jgi:hypothetical protein
MTKGCHVGAGWAKCGQSTKWKTWKCADAKANYAVETLNNPDCVTSENLNIDAIRDLTNFCGSNWRDNYLDETSSSDLGRVSYLVAMGLASAVLM